MINDDRPLQQFRYPSVPRCWLLLGLFVLCLGIGACYIIKTALVDEGGLLYWQHGAVLPMALSALLSDAAFYSLNCDTSVRRSPPRRDRS